MHYNRSCFSSKCVTSSQKNVFQNWSVPRGALVQIARCVYVTRTRGNNAIIYARINLVGCASVWRKLFLYLCHAVIQHTFIRDVVY